MTATAAQIARLRRMTDEPTAVVYSDEDLQSYIEEYPCLDELGQAPYTWDTTTEPPTQDANDAWIPTYDLHAAAADVWEEKAAGVAEDYDFRADGGSYTRDQAYKHYMRMVRHHRARSKPKSLMPHQWPREGSTSDNTNQPWVLNMPEETYTE